ncbi:MAG: aldo/keto reductase [Lachnospiraceae bacterium]|nr:aldo/keto reductase [Lachnospiraceae bacterium]
MKYTYLGTSGLKVSRFCLGSMMFGNTIGKEESFKILDCAREAGINFLDTSNNYGGPSGPGATERIIGEWFAQGGGRREDMILETKCYYRISEKPDPNEDNGLSLYKIRRCINQSLENLKTDHVELYIMHHHDPNVSWVELMDAYQGLIAQGKIDYLGSSNTPAFELALAQAEAEKRHFQGIVCEQSSYNLLERDIENELIPAVRKMGKGLTVYHPLCGGVLADNIFNPRPGSRTANYELDEKLTDQVKRYHALCSDLGETPSHVAMAWLLHNPDVTCPLVGVSRVEQLEDNLKVLDIQLTDDVLKELDAIFPVPERFDIKKYNRLFK